jgi:spoIIIJ-associated protein
MSETDTGAAGTQPEATQPEATEPETTESETTESETTQLETAEPEATQPETAEPEATEVTAVADEHPDAGAAADGDGADSDVPGESADESGAEGLSLHDRLEHEGDVAADYLEELLDIADLDGDLDMDVEGERAVVSIVGADLQQLVGDQGEVLDALQELTRLAVYRETGERSRLMLDVSGHRAARRLELEALAATTVSEVKASGERAALRPMSPFERKVVHDAVAAAGLTSESEGVEPRRYVVILPV